MRFQHPALSGLSPARHERLRTAGRFRWAGGTNPPSVTSLRVTPFAGNRCNGALLPLTGGYIGWTPLAGRGRDGRLAVSTLIFFNNLLSCAPSSEVGSLTRDVDRCLEGDFLLRANSAKDVLWPTTKTRSQSALDRPDDSIVPTSAAMSFPGELIETRERLPVRGIGKVGS